MCKLNEKKIGFRGYCTHNRFGEYKIPVPAQNIIYKDYVLKNNLHFKLSVSELFIKGSYVTLYSLLKELNSLEGILMCSYSMLPKNTKKRNQIFNEVLESNSQLHFVLENFVLKNQYDINKLEKIIRLKSIINLCPSFAEIKSNLELKKSNKC